MADEVATISSLLGTLRGAEAEAFGGAECAWDATPHKHYPPLQQSHANPSDASVFSKTKFRKRAKPVRPRVLPKMLSEHQTSPRSSSTSNSISNNQMSTPRTGEAPMRGNNRDALLAEFMVQYETKVKHMTSWSLPQVSSLTGSLKKTINQLPRPTTQEMQRIEALEQKVTGKVVVNKLYKSLAAQPVMTTAEYATRPPLPWSRGGMIRSASTNDGVGFGDLQGTNSRPTTAKSASSRRVHTATTSNPVEAQSSPPKNDDASEAASSDDDLPKDFMSQFKDRVYDELGLDLDAEHTYRRLYGSAARTLMSAMSGGSLRKAWRQWRNTVNDMILSEQTVAATRIQTWARVCFARAELVDRRKRLNEQQALLRMIEAQEDARQRSAVKAIANFILSRITVRKRLQAQRTVAAAIAMQRVIRGYAARKWVKAVWEWETWHAIVIQTWVRRWQAVHRVRLLRKLHIVDTLSNIVVKRIVRKQELYQQRGAALMIQRFYRCKTFRKRLRLYVRINQEMYANAIQNIVRGFLVRRSTKKLLAQRRLERMRRIEAAIVIQSVARMFLAKCQLRGLQRQVQQRHLKRLQCKQQRLKQLLLRTPDGRVIADIRAAKRMVRTCISNLHPMRAKIDNQSAVKIQKVYRGHRARMRTENAKLNKYILTSFQKRQRDSAAATTIQAQWRAHQVRMHIFGKRYAARIVQVQASARVILTLKRIRRLKEENHAARIIQRHWRGILVRRQFLALLARHKECLPCALKIQAIIRRHLAKWRVRQLLHDQRRSAEVELAVSLACLPLLFQTYQAVLESTIATPLSVQQLRSNGRRMLGPVQALFLAWCSKDSIRMEQQEFGKAMIASVKAGKSATVKSRPFYWRGYSQDLLSWLNMDEPIKLSHIDLIYSKVKRSKGHGISYLEFVHSLALLRHHHLQTTTARTRGDDLDPNDLSDEERSDDGTIHGDDPVLGEFEQREAARVALWMLLRQDPAILHLTALNTASRLKPAQSWMQTAHQSLVTRALERLGKSVIPLQSVVRSRLARKAAFRKREHRDATLLDLRKVHAAGRLQLYFLWVQAVCVVRRRAQQVFEKYVDLPTKRTYWYNPRTKARSWTKPKILGCGDCEEIPLPAEKEEFVASCGNCDAAVEVSCNMCCESFCQRCFDDIHVKGQRLEHTPAKIVYCTHCKFQLASRHCRTCSRYHRAGQLQNYCDTCFAFLHDPASIRHHEAHLKGNFKAAAAVATLSSTNIISAKQVTADPFAIAAVTQHTVLTSHQTEHLAVPCEECGNNAARWKCHDCAQIYCELCLVALHSNGPFRAHRSDKLSYLTPQMYRRSKQLTSDAVARVRLQQVLATLQIEAEARQLEAAIRIQKVYRGWRVRLIGQAYLKSKRQQQRALYRERKEQFAITATLWYRALLMFGWAPRLSGDTLEEAVLKSVSVLTRARASRYIHRNKQDLLWYPPPNSDPLTLAGRAAAKRGFDVGTYEELCTQAKWKGVRLPGNVAIKYGDSVMSTSKDFSNIVSADDLVRLNGQLIKVTAVTGATVEFNSFWTQPSNPQCVLYLIDRDDWIIRSIHATKRNVLLSSTAQKLVQFMIYVHRKLENRAMRTSRFFKSAGRPDVARVWKRKAKRAANSVKHWEMFLFDNQPEEKARRQHEAAHEEAVKAVVEEETEELTEEQLLAEAEAWVEEYDMKSEAACYRNTVTGEIALQPPAALKAKWRAQEAAELARKAHEETRARIASLRKK